MRILSEDRGVDIPYEQSIIVIDDECIKAVNPDGQAYVLARPDTYPQARRAMSMIVDAFQSGAKVAYMDCVMEEVREEC